MGMGSTLRRGVALLVGALVVGAAPVMTASAATAAADEPPLFGEHVAYATGLRPEAVAVVDADDDGRQDVLVATAEVGQDNELIVFLQQPDGTLTEHERLPIGSGRAGSIAVGDLTGDGVDEVAVAVRGSGIQVFRRYAPGGYDTWRILPTPDDLRVRIGDVTGDGNNELVSLGWGTNTVTVHRQQPGGGFGVPEVHAALHSGYDDLELGDVTGDGRTDVVVMSGQTYATPNLSVLRQRPDGSLAPAVAYTLPTANTLTNGIGVGDVTGDGRADVVASFGGNRPSSGIAVFASAGDQLATPTTMPSYDIPQPVVVADVDGDGRDDVVVLHGGWNRAGVYRQAADGSLAPEELFPIPYASHYAPHGLAVGDVTGNGHPDLVIADGNHGLVVLPNTAEDVPPPPTPGRAVVATPEVSVTPADPVATVHLERIGGSDGTLSVPWATRDGSAKAGTDYQRSTGTASFAPGVTTATVDVPITAAPGPGETRSFEVILNPAAGEPPADQVATVTIVREPASARADLGVELTSSTYDPRRGQVFTLVATATSRDGGSAVDPRLTVQVDSRLDVVAVRRVGCTATGQLSCGADALTPGAALRIDVDVTAARGGWVDISSSVTAATDDPNPANDTASLRLRPR
jgi:hypothetical protein